MPAAKHTVPLGWQRNTYRNKSWQRNITSVILRPL